MDFSPDRQPGQVGEVLSSESCSKNDRDWLSMSAIHDDLPEPDKYIFTTSPSVVHRYHLVRCFTTAAWTCTNVLRYIGNDWLKRIRFGYGFIINCSEHSHGAFWHANDAILQGFFKQIFTHDFHVRVGSHDRILQHRNLLALHRKTILCQRLFRDRSRLVYYFIFYSFASIVTLLSASVHYLQEALYKFLLID